MEDSPPYKLLKEGDLRDPQQRKSCWGRCPRWFKQYSDQGQEDQEGDWWDEDHLELQSVQEVVSRLQRRLRAMHMQLAGIRHDDEEATMEARQALKRGDTIRARAHARVALQHRALWTREHAKYENLNQVLITIREAQRNVSVAKLMAESSCTLGQLRDKMGAAEVEDLMDRIRDQAAEVTQDTRVLAEVLDEEDPAIESEMEQLRQRIQEEESADLVLPNVPTRTQRRVTTTTTNSQKERAREGILVDAK